MSRAILYILAFVLAAHGLIHLMGFVAYWPLGQVQGLPYKTALLGGRWDVGAAGMRLFAALWLVAAVGLVAGVAGLVSHQAWWRPLLLSAAVLSVVVSTLDWAVAFRGAVISLAMVLALTLAPGLIERLLSR